MTTKKATPAADPQYYYETTPYMVTQQGTKFAVYQSWWCKTISIHKTRELADEACIAEARSRGCLRQIKIKPARNHAPQLAGKPAGVTYHKVWDGNETETEGRNGRFYSGVVGWIYIVEIDGKPVEETFTKLKDVKRAYPDAVRSTDNREAGL